MGDREAHREGGEVGRLMRRRVGADGVTAFVFGEVRMDSREGGIDEVFRVRFVSPG